MLLRFLQRLKDCRQLHCLIYIAGRQQELPKVHRLFRNQRAEHMIERQHADHVVYTVLIDRKPRIRRFRDGLHDLVPVVVDIDRQNIHSRGHDLRRGSIREVDRRADQFGGVFVQDIFIFGCLDDRVEFLHGSLLGLLLIDRLAFHAFGQKIDQADHGKCHRPQQDHQETDDRRKCQRITVRILFRGDLRDRLPENNHCRRDGCGRHPGIFRAQRQQHGHGSQRRGRDIDQIVAHQDRREGIVEPVQDPENGFGRPAAVFRGVLHPHAIEGGIRHFRRRKERGPDDAQHDGCDIDSDHTAPPFRTSCSGSPASAFRTRTLRIRLFRMDCTVI